MKFTSFILALFAAFSLVNAQWISGTITSGTTVLDSNGGQLAQITLSDTSGSANTVILYDSGTTSTNIVLPGYTGRQYYTTNIVKTWTDSVGNTVSRTNRFLFSAPLTVSASTNEANRLYSITIPANGAVVIEPPGNLGFTYGLLIKNAGALSYNARLIDR